MEFRKHILPILSVLCVTVMNNSAAMHLQNVKSDADSVRIQIDLKGQENDRTISEGEGALSRDIPISTGHVSRDIGSVIGGVNSDLSNSDNKQTARIDITDNTNSGGITHSASDEHVWLHDNVHVHNTRTESILKAGQLHASEVHAAIDEGVINEPKPPNDIPASGIDKVEKLSQSHAGTGTKDDIGISHINKVEKISTDDTESGITHQQSPVTSTIPDDVIYHDYLDDINNDYYDNELFYQEETVAAVAPATTTTSSTTSTTTTTTTPRPTQPPATTRPTQPPTTTRPTQPPTIPTTTTTRRSPPPPPTTTTTSTTTTTEPKKEDDVDPLGIFVDDITFQRFPKPMTMTDFKDKVLGNTYKKLYILEETPGDAKPLFGNVRQMESLYFMKNGSLYVDFLFRFIFSRKCTEINEYRLGSKAGLEQYAMFAKDTKNNQTERLLFFSDHPSDYLYLMACTDMKTSPYACRGSYYVTLESSRDPPNSFKWLEASMELKNKMNLTFDDPRFMFNFVMTPCVWRDGNRRTKVT